MREFTNKEKELIVNTPITEECFDIEGIEKIGVAFNRFVMWLDSVRISFINGYGEMSDEHFRVFVKMLPNSYKVVEL